MKNIITINREFGSGGREIGKRLADRLGFDYYDREILTHISEKTGFAESFIDTCDEELPMLSGLTFCNSFMSPADMPATQVYVGQTQFISSLQDKGNCIIIGRCADYILKDSAFKILIYSSDMNKKIQRCYEKNPSDKDKSPEEMEKLIKSIDKQRNRYYNFYANGDRFDARNYDLCINTSIFPIKDVVDLIAAMYGK